MFVITKEQIAIYFEASGFRICIELEILCEE